jgi:hypothetical protein
MFINIHKKKMDESSMWIGRGRGGGGGPKKIISKRGGRGSKKMDEFHPSLKKPLP